MIRIIVLGSSISSYNYDVPQNKINLQFGISGHESLKFMESCFECRVVHHEVAKVDLRNNTRTRNKRFSVNEHANDLAVHV